jgi:hypothetical protein
VLEGQPYYFVPLLGLSSECNEGGIVVSTGRMAKHTLEFLLTTTSVRT